MRMSEGEAGFFEGGKGGVFGKALPRLPLKRLSQPPVCEREGNAC